MTPTTALQKRILQRLLLPLVVALALLTPAIAQAQAALHGQDVTLLVRFQPEVGAQERAAAIAALGGEETAWIAPIHVAEVRITASSAQASQVMAQSALDHHTVVYAEVDTAVSAATTLPNDPAFSDAAMSYGLQRVQAPAAWELTRGNHDIVIAVVDSGVKLDHPAFAGRLVAGYDFVNQDAWPDDDAGHGTHVAGIIAAAIDDGQGMAGLCPACRIMPVKVLNAASLGTWSQLAQGIIFATDHGARVINLSLGATIPSQTLAAAIDYAHARGAIVVAAGGNHGNDAPFYPAVLDGVIAVAATNAQDARWDRSAYGSHIDLSAPGDLIYSTYADLNNVFGGYTYMSGTSMATPYVSALAGLALSLEPSLSPADVFQALVLGADDLGEPGWDPYFGHGRINAVRTLRAPVAGLVEAVAESVRPTLTMQLYLPGVLR